MFLLLLLLATMANDLIHIQSGIAQGDEIKLAELYKLFHKRLQHFSRLIIRNDEIAEEVVDDVFVKLWARRTKIQEIENLTVYLYIAVKNQSLNALSKKAQELITESFSYLDIDIKEAVGSPDELMITSEMMSNMQAAVDALPPRCKMIFKLIREDGLRYKEVAQILNISVNTIDVQMAIAVKRICSALQISRQSKTPSLGQPEKKL
ncbi:MAG TPA: RNA polymerase sigma-70 factor [Panacibacter sp.]|nr:RNA polymerase sigma-70 factor [Panacibacter sp.]HNP44786.1 RNA polymerase sigma-70 factor [Panacibacter sp.]